MAPHNDPISLSSGLFPDLIVFKMASLSIILGILTATYIFLRYLLHLTQDAKEPPAMLTNIPFLGPLPGMIREKSSFYIRLRDTHKNLPIYTLRLPFMRIYVVNSTDLIPPLQKQWLSVSFASIAAGAGATVGLSPSGQDLLKQNLGTEHGFSETWPKHIMPAMSPGTDLDNLNRTAIEVFAHELDALYSDFNTHSQGIKVGLRSWTRGAMVKATSFAVWGSQNPYKDADVSEAWRIFESGFLNLSLFPFAARFFPEVYKARETAANAMLSYVKNNGHIHPSASGLVKKRYEHHVAMHGMSLEDFARGELGNSFAVLGNSTPCAFWVLWHIYSDPKVLADIREEVSTLVQQNGEVNEVDLGKVRSACPILLSTFMETLRHRTINAGPRQILQDVEINGFLLKKGNMLMVPGPVQHTNVEAWGSDAREFDHLRFTNIPTAQGPRKRPNRVAFRAFGGGHVLCPGRHFATTEIMALAALLVVRFDIVPEENGGRWVEPRCDNTPVQAGFPIPDVDFPVALKPRDAGRKWKVTFSGSDKAVGVVAEDLPAGTE